MDGPHKQLHEDRKADAEGSTCGATPNGHKYRTCHTDPSPVTSCGVYTSTISVALPTVSHTVLSAGWVATGKEDSTRGLRRNEAIRLSSSGPALATARTAVRLSTCPSSATAYLHFHVNFFAQLRSTCLLNLLPCLSARLYVCGCGATSREGDCFGKQGQASRPFGALCCTGTRSVISESGLL